MDDFESKELEGMEPDTIIFEDEDGNEFEFEVRDYFFYNGDESGAGIRRERRGMHHLQG